MAGHERKTVNELLDVYGDWTKENLITECVAFCDALEDERGKNERLRKQLKKKSLPVKCEVEYRLIWTDNKGDLEHSVSNALKEGWELHGSTFVMDKAVCQAIVRTVPLKKN